MKPIVKYDIMITKAEVGNSVMLHLTSQHHSLPTAREVCTSEIVSIDGTTIETLNTIYVKEAS